MRKKYEKEKGVLERERGMTKQKKIMRKRKSAALIIGRPQC